MAFLFFHPYNLGKLMYFRDDLIIKKALKVSFYSYL